MWTLSIFACGYLDFLDRLQGGDGLQNGELSTSPEIVLGRTDGALTRMGVIRTSGVSAFDIGALDSVQRAAPASASPSQ